VTIADSTGRQVATMQGTNTAGINTVVWNARAGGGGGRGAGSGGGGGGGGGRGGSGNPIDQWAPLGEYTVTLDIGGAKFAQKARIVKTQGWTIGPVPQVIR
jgi:hypothetical protein